MLHERRLIVAEDTVVVERVRLTKDEGAGEETVTDKVRKEQTENGGVIELTENVKTRNRR